MRKVRKVRKVEQVWGPVRRSKGSRGKIGGVEKG